MQKRQKSLQLGLDILAQQTKSGNVNPVYFSIAFL
jgi:hypothetical protein